MGGGHVRGSFSSVAPGLSAEEGPGGVAHSLCISALPLMDIEPSTNVWIYFLFIDRVLIHPKNYVFVSQKKELG